MKAKQVTVGNFTGNAKFYKNRVLFLNDKNEIFAALVKNKHGTHFVNAGEIEGKIFYMFGMGELTEEIFGFKGVSYSKKHDVIKELANQLIAA